MRKSTEAVSIRPPQFEVGEFSIVGTAPLVMEKFSKKAQDAIIETQTQGSKAKKGKSREPRDFDRDYEESKHISEEGWVGIPCSAFRNALVSACRLVGFTMTRAKLGLFVESDGLDASEGSPLVKLIGEPEKKMLHVRNSSGVCDLRCRPMWREWSATVRIRYDADMFDLADVANLLMRVGMQVGLLGGRPDSKTSCGLGFGLFRITD